MKRIKLVDARMNLEQLRVMSEIGTKYAKGFIDFTTRQNVQFHYILIKDIPAIFDMLDSVGLTSRMASGDGPRPIMTCPVSGLDNSEIYDVQELLKSVDSYFDQNDDRFCNFPRKFKLGISGCGNHCANHEIQDVAFTAFKDKNENILFDLTIGGGLSKSKQIASRAKKYVKAEQVLDVSIACAEIFRDNGNRDSRNKARVRHLLNDWGIEKFVDEIEKILGYKLQDGEIEPNISSFENRNHFGINRQKKLDFSYVGFATNSGRVAGDDFVKFYEICKKYGAGGVALTSTQNFVVYDVKNEVVQELADEFEVLGYSYKPTAFRARLQSCTGREFCKFGVTETKKYAKNIVLELENRLKDFNEDVSISISGCSHGCSQPHIADIGLIGCLMKYEGQRVEGYELFLGGNLQGINSRLSQKIGLKVPSHKVVDYIVSLIDNYKTDNKGALRFKDYLTTIEPINLRSGEED